MIKEQSFEMILANGVHQTEIAHSPSNGDRSSLSRRSPAVSAGYVLERAKYLVRQAMLSLESDREAAWRSLHDASTLLGAEAPDSPVVATGSPRANRLADWQLQRTLAHIEANLSSKLEIRHLASLVGLSKSHFCRCFRHSLGVSPIAYVLTRRVERVKAMMVSRKERLSEIALACGFADQSHLSRCFRQVVGVSPGRWRRIHAAPPESEAERQEGLSADAPGTGLAP
jgi:AraC family transcriptional regulator